MEKTNSLKNITEALGGLEERTNLPEKEVWMMATEAGNLEALEEFGKLARGEITRSEMKTQLQCQHEKYLQLKPSVGGENRKQVFGFGAVTNIAQSPGSALLTPEAEQMRSLSIGGEQHAKKRGFFSRIFGR